MIQSLPVSTQQTEVFGVFKRRAGLKATEASVFVGAESAVLSSLHTSRLGTDHIAPGLPANGADDHAVLEKKLAIYAERLPWQPTATPLVQITGLVEQWFM